jgi:hypothetical protein
MNVSKCKAGSNGSNAFCQLEGSLYSMADKMSVSLQRWNRGQPENKKAMKLHTVTQFALKDNTVLNNIYNFGSHPTSIMKLIRLTMLRKVITA